MTEELEKRCRKRWEALKTERTSWITQWQDISKVLLPRSGRFLADQNNKGDERSVDIQDNSGTRALRTLAGGMMAGMTSPARPWFRLTTLDPELDEDYEVKVWMSQTTQLMQMIFTRSNVYRALHMAYEELGAFGTSATVVLDDYDRVIHCMPLTIGEYALSTDARGRVNTLYREFRMTVAALVAEFGYANVSKATRTAFDRQRYDDWVTVINAIEPRDMRNPDNPDGKHMPYRSVYFEESTRGRSSSGILRESGFRHFPALCGRWHVTGGDIYGNSPGMEALGDLRQLQTEQFRKAQAIDYMANPPVIVPADFKDSESSVLPGGVIYVESEQQAKAVRSAFQVQLDLQGVLLDIQDCRNRINEAFYKDIFLMHRTHILKKSILELMHLTYIDILHQTLCSTIQNGYLFGNRHWRILRLYQQLIILSSTIKSHCCYRVDVAAKLGECLQLTILSLVNLQSSGHFLHGLDLCTTTDTRHGNTRIDGRTETLVEQVCFQEYLTVGDRNHVRRNISRYVSCLSLNDWKCC